MNVLAAGPAERSDRPASAVLFDHEHARVVGFNLLPGQKVAAHRSDSTVTIHVTSGSGVFRGADAEHTLSAGEIAVFAPGEVHAMDAGEEPLRFVAVITPRPGG